MKPHFLRMSSFPQFHHNILLFDFGGVLVNLDKTRCIDAFSKAGFDITPYLGTYKQGGAFAQFERGEITPAQVCDALYKDSGVRLSETAFQKAWESYLTDVPKERLEMLLRLKKKYRLALLSNTNSIHWHMAIERFFRYKGLTVEDFFSDIFLSFEMGIEKPSPIIFEKVIDALGVPASQIVFFDDSIINCKAAEACGMQSFHAKANSAWLPQAEALLRPAVATIGNFDGVHIGHRFVLDKLKAKATETCAQSMVITFNPHPHAVLNPKKAPPQLTTTAEKCVKLRQLGITQTIVLPFTPSLAALTAEDFMTLLRDEIGVKILLMGYDHRFGCDKIERFEEYQAIGKRLGIDVLSLPEAKEKIAYETYPAPINSSILRHFIATGAVEKAKKALGETYRLQGKVVKGRQTGRQLGFPTANLAVSPDKLLPAEGIYATQVKVADRRYNAMTYIGRRPTMHNGNDCTIETNIFDFNGNLYGQLLDVFFITRLRDDIKFDSLDALKTQLIADEKAAKKALAQNEVCQPLTCKK